MLQDANRKAQNRMTSPGICSYIAQQIINYKNYLKKVFVSGTDKETEDARLTNKEIFVGKSTEDFLCYKENLSLPIK